MERIIFTQDNGATVGVIIPVSGNAQDAIKDIPSGAIYKIVTVDDIPSDRTFRDAWEVTLDETWVGYVAPEVVA